jgi:hypothetical protein
VVVAFLLLLLAGCPAMFAVGLASPAEASPAHDAATGWSSRTLVDPYRGDPTSISCPTTTVCAAVDAFGNALRTALTANTS